MVFTFLLPFTMMLAQFLAMGLQEKLRL